MEFATLMCHSFLLVMALNALEMTTSIVIQSVGHVWKATAVSFIRQIILLIPISLILAFAFNKGIYGVLYAGCISDVLCFISTIIILKSEYTKLVAKQEKVEENQEQKAIAKKKGIPENNVLIVRDNSNFYKDHPEVERDLIFSRDKDGLVKAEYIDENGELQPSKYIMPPTTGNRQETVSIGSDGNPVTKESPQQVMQTRNLTGRDQDIRDVRINIKFDTY